MSSNRQLAAILFSDLVGYTELMGRDNQAAMNLVKSAMKLQKPIVLQHRGKWLKEMGDGVLVQFQSAQDAVECALDIQKMARAELNAQLRIGIHLGDVTIEEDDVFGDGVNVASRLEVICDPGGIYISESVKKAITGSDIETIPLNEVELKGVSYPVRPYAIQASGLPAPEQIPQDLKYGFPSVKMSQIYWTVAIFLLIGLGYWISMQVTGPRSAEMTEKAVLSSQEEIESSIAVLPFINLSANLEQQYFADGVMEDILTHLQKIEGLRVPGRTSSERYRETEKSISEIATELRVSYLLEGSVRRAGDQVMITAQLIDAKEDQHIWADNFTSVYDAASLFDIQQEIALGIVEQMKLKILPEQIREITRASTTSTEAYENFLIGREWYLQVKLKSLDSAEFYLRKAVELDPSFGQANGLLANVFGLRFHNYTREFPLLDSTEKYANKGLQFEENCDWCYKALYWVEEWKYKNDIKALAMLQKALEINPNNQTVNWNLQRLYFIHGRYEEAFPLTKKDDWEYQMRVYGHLGDQSKVKRLLDYHDLKWGIDNMDSPISLRGYTMQSFRLGQRERFINGAKQFMKIDPSERDNLMSYKVMTFWLDEQYDSIAFYHKKFPEEMDDYFLIMAAYYRIGDTTSSMALAEEAIQDVDEPILKWDAFNLGVCALYKNNLDESVMWLTRAFELGTLFPYDQIPFLEPLYNDEAFKDLVSTQKAESDRLLKILDQYDLAEPEQTISNAEFSNPDL